MKRKKKTGSALLPAAILLLVIFAGNFASCSSAPKRPAEIFSQRNIAASQIELANKTAGRGRYEDALLILSEARRLAIAADDPALRIETLIVRAGIFFSLGRMEEAFMDWERARAEGAASGQKELAALSRIYSIRASLALLSNSGSCNQQNLRSTIEEFKSEINREMQSFERRSPNAAAAHVTLGMADKLLERWGEAEAAVKTAVEIHERNRLLEDAAYDWFLIASIRSLAGNYDSAVAALEMSISFDRRAENSYGLAASWQALGEVYAKAGRAEESAAASLRAAEIYGAIGLDNRALNTEAYLPE